MHRLIIIVSLSIITNIAICQIDEEGALYASGELNFGNYFGIDLNVNYVHNEEYSFKIGYTGNNRTPKSQPEDYSSGLRGILLLGLADPYDQFENYQIGIGKIYKMNKSGSIRANISIGLGYTVLREPENWERISNSSLIENYTWNYKNRNTISFIFNPKIEFPFTRIYGLTISPMLQLSKDRTYYGVGIGQMIGVLRKRNS